MKALIQIVGADVLCRSLGTPAQEFRIDGASAPAILEALARRYETATRRSDEAELFAIGRALFDWLNPGGWASAWAKASGPRELEILVDDPAQPLARALLDAPWELLAREGEYLADDAVQLFELARRIGVQGTPTEPRHGDVQLMFMAAAPAGEHPLAFEDEESAILDATRRLPLHLVVEESGCAEFLGERLSLDGPFEALHLSCHGDIDTRRGPILLLEDETGRLALTDVGQLIGALGEPQATPLVFLSACRTAEQIEAGERSSEPFVRELVRAGIANELGWDGRVYDADALAYARRFYCELASLQSVPRAAAIARQGLRRRQIKHPRQGHHWHLARLYLGPVGGGRLAAKGKPKRKLAAGGEQFLDAARKEVPVAGPQAFVGRRRALQAVLRAWRDGATGVLIHGMGNLGKSSLAFRASMRMTRHEKVVVFGKYDALSVFDRIIAALPPLERKPAIDTWREAVLANPEQLADALETFLEGPLDAKPILLVVDDLERILEAPRAAAAVTSVKEDYRPMLGAVLRAFQRTRSESRLLVTSRYRFSLPERSGVDLAEKLVRVPLQPMDGTERAKQLRAAARLAQREDYQGVNTDLQQRALRVAEGNPGLQATLTRPILAGENAVAEKALAVIEHYRKTGTAPDDIGALIAQGVAGDEANDIVDFFRRMAFDTYRAALTASQAQMLRTCCLFSAGLPVPRQAAEAAGRAAKVADASAALDRLLGLGLADDWGTENGPTSDTALIAANPLARPLAGGLDAALIPCLASAALPELERHWRNRDGGFPSSPRAVEVTRLALVADAPELTLLDDAAQAAARLLFNAEHNARRAHDDLLVPALARLDAMRVPVSTGFLLIAADCAERLGERGALDEAIERLGEVTGGADAGSAKVRVGRWSQMKGDLDAAETAFADAANRFYETRQERDWAIARGELANILHARGELDEALRLLQDDVLAAFKRLGDVRSKAVTMGQIADILHARGELDEALRIRREEELPVFERLGDVRSKAMTMGQIADILHARGELDEALRLLQDDVLAAFKRLGDVRKKAVTMGKIADILHARGELDEALALQQERLPIAERLGHIDSLAHIRYSRARIRLKRGDHERADLQEIYEDLAVAFELSRKLGRPDFISGIGWLLAQVLAMGGSKEEALAVLEEAEAAWRKLGDAQGIALAAELRAKIGAPH